MWRVGAGTQDPIVVSVKGRGSPCPLSCVKGLSGVWCSYRMCSVSSSLFHWLHGAHL